MTEQQAAEFLELFRGLTRGIACFMFACGSAWVWYVLFGRRG